jgi:hypothetical protein
MAYAKAKTTIDQLASAMGPTGGAGFERDENGDIDPATVSSGPNPNDIRKAFIEKQSGVKFVNDWTGERPLNMPEAIAKQIEERMTKGEDVEADLNKKIVSYQHRLPRNWSEKDLEVMDKAEEDDKEGKFGKSFVKW